ncbi:MAG TPA: histidine kinase dimerization/phospho-acceptor domain-containing protein [Pirellulales bacterium]|jgi:signal transduction histidine kinase|nr:histidine kinase dimerization/phospho-acceptor domain-containing protein [Pirellulales bacterium]
MTDRAAVAILWSTAAVGAALVLTTASPWLEGWAWPLRFGWQALVIGAAGSPLWLARRRAWPEPGANPSLTRFLSVADHEMKTPLAGIKAYVELLADGDADDEATREEFLTGISSQTERLERTIDELLELVRGECPVPNRRCSLDVNVTRREP